MKKTLLSLFLALAATAMYGVPAERVRMSVCLGDGTTVAGTLVGDETFSFLRADDGRLLVPAADGGVLWQVVEAQELDSSIQRARKAASPRTVGSVETAPLPVTGSPCIPVVLINFTDSVFQVAQTDEALRQYYDKYFNGTRDGQLYRGHGSYGAVRDYFAMQSDSAFLPEFVILGPVTVDNPESYYGSNSGNSKDSRSRELYLHAIQKMSQTMTADDWLRFDNKGKGQVDMVFFIFAGAGENSGAASTTLWPKESVTGMTVDNVRFATAALCSENRCKRSGGVVVAVQPDGIGVVCHELSHAMGLPDFYDTRSNASNFGMDLWSIMDYGCYGSNGYQPSGYNAYERDFMGWRPLVELTEPQDLTLAPMEQQGRGYKVVCEENPNEYYIVENRQSVGWDMSTCQMGHGLQVTHVDYVASAWNSNTVNSSTNQHLTIVAANNRYIGTTHTSDATELKKTWAGNLYPYTDTATGLVNDSLTAYSTPAATTYCGDGFLHQGFYAIRETDGWVNTNKSTVYTVRLHYGNDYTDGVEEVEGQEGNGPRVQEGNGSRVQEGKGSSSTELYDLSGRRLGTSQHPRGLYITNGKKILAL